ncbi:MAG: cell division protein FtsK [Gammaproteobacteria bacterium]|nr:MAG: cell division protein FtsK [Gammaproteobacteria bacterium]
MSRRIREGVMILLATISLFLFMAMMTYSSQDPGWSTTGQGSQINNAGGRAGAWFADAFLKFFGYLAYVFPLMLAYVAYLSHQVKTESEEINRLFVTFRSVGFILTLIAGSGLAYMHFFDPVEQSSYKAGGILGEIMGKSLIPYFGFLGGTLMLLALFLIGFTWFTGISWLSVMDNLGRITLHLLSELQVWFHKAREKFTARQTKQRSVKTVKKERKKVDKRPPIKIEPIINRVEPSIRIEKERQVKLFDEPVEGEMPPVSLLDPAAAKKHSVSSESLEAMSRLVEMKLADFSIDAQVVEVHPGPVITRFELDLAPGVKVSKISNLSKDLARALSAISVRIVEVIPGKSVIGLEIPNEDREMVRLSEVISSKAFDDATSDLSMCLGKDIAGQPVIVNLDKMPHLLVAGTTGSGKSVGINAMIISLLYKSKPEDVRMIMIDPKMLELSVYDGIPHLLAPVVTDMKDAANSLRWCVGEMERRYKLMSSMGVRNLAGYNKKIRDGIKKGTPLVDPLWEPTDNMLLDPPELETLPSIVVIIDELADMMMIVGKKVEELIARIAQKARAAGIHLILATQRPSVDVLTGLIKANIPSRMAFQVSSRIDSRTILDQMGAEQLLGQGDMLYMPAGSSIPTRVHGAFVADHEVHKVVADWRKRGQPEFIEEITNGGGVADAIPGMPPEPSDDDVDVLYDEAVAFVTHSRKASISSVQRRLKVGYNRAARMIEEMEATGVVSEMQSNGSREVLAPAPPAMD